MITLRLRHIFIFAFAILLTACQFEDDQDCPKEEHFSSSYINLTIAVSDGQGRTRANEPLAGEDGNGREAGFERENAVTGVTLILYKDANGINTTTTNPTLDFVRFFPVKRVENGTATQGTAYNPGTGDESHNSQIEAAYTTGPQLIGKEGVLKISLSEKYHAIVVANHDLTSGLTEGVSKLSDVRDMTLSAIASGSMTDLAYTFGNFVMSSEEDNTIDFGATNTKKTLAGTAWTENDRGQDVLYDLTAQPLIIERMAARIDFWAMGATYQTKNGDGTGSGTYNDPGYVYRPWKTTDTESTGPTSSDRFVLTRITPFNLNNSSSYLLKQLSDGRLKPETGSNYVIDPTTANKANATFLSPLSAIVSGLANWSANDYSHFVADMHAQVGNGLTGGFGYTSGSTAEDIIICYPKENTLPDGSSLYNYATGIMIEGDYYTGDDVSKCEHRFYFTYIRHQGESETAYDALLPSELSTETKTSNNNPMNFGIVRNNIYRISIDKVHEKTDETPKITLKIMVKKWDKFEHEPIYM